MSTISASTTTTTAYKVTADTTGTLVLQTGATPTTAVTIDGSQNVGVGVTSPASRVDVLSASTGVVKFTSGKSGWLYADSAGIALSDTADFTKNGLYINNTSNYVAVYTGSTGAERARIDASGNLLVGTATAGAGWGAGGKITADMTSSYTVLKSTNGASSPELLCWSATGTSDNSFVLFATETGGTTRGSIDYNRAGGLTRYNTTSDATLKNIIGDADGAKSVDILKSTRIREYSWKDDEANKPQIGVIAQELHETFKGAVSVGGDRTEVDEEGNETTRYAPWAVDKTAFTFHLIAGWQAHEKIIQEQQALITQLQADVAALKG